MGRGAGGRTAALAALVLAATVVLPAGGLQASRAAARAPATERELAPAATCRLPGSLDPGVLGEGPSDFGFNLRPEGVVTAVMLFVDFPDHPEAGPTAPYVDQLAPAADWFDEVSYGRLDLQVTPVDQWFRMPQASTDYLWPTDLTFANHRDYLADAVEAADPSVDFGLYDIVYVVPADSAEAFEISPTFLAFPGAGVDVDGTEVRHAVTFGQDLWSWGSEVLNHETGHVFSLPDLYAFTGDLHRFVGGWDLMGMIDGGAPGFLAWHRWKLGWIDGSQIDCVTDVGHTEHELSLLAQPGGTEAVVVRTGRRTAYVAEYRGGLGVDAGLCDDGLLVYRVDTAVPSGTGPIQVVDAHPTTTAPGCHPLGDAPFETGPGENAVFTDPAAGVTIEVTGRTDEQIEVQVDVVPAPDARCAGRAATVDLARGQRPTAGPDVILGTLGADSVNAGRGNDLVCARAGRDAVVGGPGADRILGAGGNDILTGGDGNDVLDGGPGVDVLRGLAGADRLLGGPGRDQCNGGLGRDAHVGCEVRISIP